MAIMVRAGRGYGSLHEGFSWLALTGSYSDLEAMVVEF
jgi:hypothetical protein